MTENNLYINYELITDKLADIKKSVALLNTIGQVEPQKFYKDEILVSGAKYQLILSIEAAQSICNHLAARIAKEAPRSYADCFRILGDNGILSRDLVQKLVSMARFRNLLANQYGKVDNSIVLDILKHNIVDLITYTKEIKLFISSARG
ncbi:type VII toxin-antitoxin system HepT family RNase toxin [Desulfallas thermosapovorans]|uniref:Uncharacterized protein YutE (UPF0331/DUF86 family) n=1 Tax=Desulfallas thermosapovorans DSM 6562 TaxID=1121431 RepID=A0A5S4ZSL7_9FIRM|nr:DUF86 domain-containing protein [Desulfallas thermosapovorans]TYO95652.1 uncharacterized protein YutE (UPF0331/DUF86 family) [Desulfallas thermosapovorans DSM 6562]